jgi:hypothetical protein
MTLVLAHTGQARHARGCLKIESGERVMRTRVSSSAQADDPVIANLSGNYWIARLRGQ